MEKRQVLWPELKHRYWPGGVPVFYHMTRKKVSVKCRICNESFLEFFQIPHFSGTINMCKKCFIKGLKQITLAAKNIEQYLIEEEI